MSNSKYFKYKYKVWKQKSHDVCLCHIQKAPTRPCSGTAPTVKARSQESQNSLHHICDDGPRNAARHILTLAYAVKSRTCIFHVPSGSNTILADCSAGSAKIKGMFHSRQFHSFLISKSTGSQPRMKVSASYKPTEVNINDSFNSH